MKKLQKFQELINLDKSALIDKITKDTIKGGQRDCKLTGGNAWDIDIVIEPEIDLSGWG